MKGTMMTRSHKPRLKMLSLTTFGWGSGIAGLLELCRRHGPSAVRHMTFLRLLNAIHLSFELLLRRRVVSARPLVIKIEPTNICNLKCPGCRTGSGEDTSPRSQISFDTFTAIVDQMAPHAFKLILYMWGEPLIHKDIFKMVRYAREKNLAVQISSNLNIFREGFADELVDSGLDHLIVALDGVSQEVYQQYRIGGRVEKVITNTTKIVEAKRRKHSRFPIVELQYITFPHNLHELAPAKELAQDLEVDRFSVIDLVGNHNPELARSKNGRQATPDKCNALWIMGCFNWDGGFSPCCDSVDDSFGNILEQDFADIWNGAKMQKSRSLHTSTPINDGPHTKCSRCRIYGSHVTFLPEPRVDISLESLRVGATASTGAEQ